MATSCRVGCRCSSDLALLWLCCRLAAAALIQPLAQELPYVAGAALKRKKKERNTPLPGLVVLPDTWGFTHKSFLRKPHFECKPYELANKIRNHP